MVNCSEVKAALGLCFRSFLNRSPGFAVVFLAIDLLFLLLLRIIDFLSRAPVVTCSFLHVLSSCGSLKYEEDQGTLDCDYITGLLKPVSFCRRKIFEGNEDLHNDKDSMRRPCLQGVVPATRSSPCFSACNGDASSHTSDVDAERDHNQSEPPSSTGTSVHNGWPYRSGYVMPIVDDSEDHLEIPQNGELLSHI